MKGLGKGVKEYKKAMNGIEDEVNSISGDAATQTTTQEPRQEESRN
jgi:Sec-independent protein translocase protein TatA